MDIKELVRPNILKLKPYTSARDIYSSGILLDANENSLGSTFPDSDKLELNRYPDPHQKDLREAVSGLLKIGSANLFFGVGSDEVIDLLIRIFCEPGRDNVIIPEPTYGMYKVSCDINNIETREVLLTDTFQLNIESVLTKCDENTKIIFLCSPNNPTGNLLSDKDIFELCEKTDSIIAVDEAYIDFAEGSTVINYISKYPRLVVLRTFSKAWGLAGIRLGYCAADTEIINLLFKVKAPYNINSLTRNAVLAAIANQEQKEKYVKAIIKERERLKNMLESLYGVHTVFPSDANYLLFKCGDPKGVLKKLADKGIIIRDRSSQPKLEGCLRISIGTEEENDKFWEEIRKLL